MINQKGGNLPSSWSNPINIRNYYDLNTVNNSFNNSYGTHIPISQGNLTGGEFPNHIGPNLSVYPNSLNLQTGGKNMKLYDNIINPKNGKMVSIYSKKGIYILKKYMKKIYF